MSLSWVLLRGLFAMAGECKRLIDSQQLSYSDSNGLRHGLQELRRHSLSAFAFSTRPNIVTSFKSLRCSLHRRFWILFSTLVFAAHVRLCCFIRPRFTEQEREAHGVPRSGILSRPSFATCVEEFLAMGFEYKIFDGCKKLIDTLVQDLVLSWLRERAAAHELPRGCLRWTHPIFSRLFVLNLRPGEQELP